MECDTDELLTEPDDSAEPADDDRWPDDELERQAAESGFLDAYERGLVFF